MRNYFEFYEYDEVGNILSFDHKAHNGNWIRAYEYNEANLIEPGKKSNRLSGTIVHPNSQQPIPEPYTYDSHGNMTSMPHLDQMEWDFEDQLHSVEKGSEKIYYVYDAAGERMRKVVEKNNNGNLIEERIYLGGFEIYRKHSGSGLTLERETLHIMDDEQRIAMVETKTHDDGAPVPAPTPLTRYQLGNHLGSSSLELDESGAIISYEEYHPYGTTAYHATRSGVEVSAKRYRYTGKERDEETGLNYHGARYYAPWLGRWVSCDPLRIEDGSNIFVYTRNNPIRYIDMKGSMITELPATGRQLKLVPTHIPFKMPIFPIPILRRIPNMIMPPLVKPKSPYPHLRPLPLLKSQVSKKSTSPSKQRIWRILRPRLPPDLFKPKTKPFMPPRSGSKVTPSTLHHSLRAFDILDAFTGKKTWSSLEPDPLKHTKDTMEERQTTRKKESLESVRKKPLLNLKKRINSYPVTYRVDGLALSLDVVGWKSLALGKSEIKGIKVRGSYAPPSSSVSISGDSAITKEGFEMFLKLKFVF